ncbi:MAG: hypothetical protein JW814_09120 [Candidatus Krumholzibacteriota bacterium]|nr:hypothetical protein [Candidatus Krumholzibacteriota bacterium]
MKRISIATLALVLVISLSGISLGADRWEEQITISPQVLVLDFAGTRISIHSIIPAADLVKNSIYIEVNGAGPIAPCGLGVDLRGNIVVKVRVDDIRQYVAPPSAEIALRGLYVSGEELFATGTVGIR